MTVTVVSNASERTETTFGPRYMDRRTRTRLRELCDEVLASFRAATRGDLFSSHEREEAQRLLARVAPSLYGTAR